VYDAIGGIFVRLLTAVNPFPLASMSTSLETHTGLVSIDADMLALLGSPQSLEK
jgi:hypothetical protein